MSPRNSSQKSLSATSVPVSLGERSYDILVGHGLLAEAGRLIAQAVRGGPSADGRTAAIVTNPEVSGLYSEPLEASLNAAGFKVVPVILPADERGKTLRTVEMAYQMLYDAAVDRRCVVVALGGGVVGDMAGFIAASYQRGLDFVQVPTTLLAHVDSSVGGKVGVNFAAAKNLIGAFHQPRLVLIDPETLRTLPAGERRSGLAEVVKYGAIADEAFFAAVSREAPGILDLTSPYIGEAIAHSCRIKARIVEQDERETGGLRATLNFGHTIGHALEAATDYKRYRHGEAIAIGMVSACLIGEELGITAPNVTSAVLDVLQRSGFQTVPDNSLRADDILPLLSRDKKAVNGSSRFVLLERLGHATSGHSVADEVIRAALARQSSLKSG